MARWLFSAAGPHWQDLEFVVQPVNQQAAMPWPGVAIKLDNNVAEFGHRTRRETRYLVPEVGS
jgi:hypothetical protein